VKLAVLAVAAVVVGGAIEAPHLPPLPRDGFVSQTKTGLELTTLAGRRVATLPRYRFAFECGFPGAGALRGDGRVWSLDAARSRLVPRPRLRKTCLHARNLVAGGRRIAGPAAKIGSWQRVWLSPDRRTALALWSGECEIPTTYLVRVRDHRLTSLGSETRPIGWTHDGRAVVEFANGCGSPPKPPGIYLVSAGGRVLARALALPPRGLAVALWTS
jgi:hypothetical protein